MTAAVPTLDYQLRRGCGKWTAYLDGPRMRVAWTPAPPGWRVVVGRTLKWLVLSLVVAALLAAAASEPKAGLSWVVFGTVGFWLVGLWGRLRKRRRGPGRGGPEFIAGPEGLSWYRPGCPPWTFSSDAVATVKLHVSPPALRRAHPVSVVLVLRTGEQHVLDHGTLDEAELLANAIEQGLGIGTPTEVGDD